MRLTFLTIAVSSLLGACSPHLVSPLNTISNAYVPNSFNPSNKGRSTETYIGAGFTAAHASYADKFYYGSLNLAQSHCYKFIRANYSAGLLLGSANVKKDVYGHTANALAYKQINGGNLFSGAFGGNCSLSFVIPLRSNKIEWRMLGVLVSGFREFGTYTSFRKNYPASDTLYSYWYDGDVRVERSRNKFSAGLFTEFELAINNGGHLGFRVASSLTEMFKPTAQNRLTANPYYTSLTVFFSREKYHAFLQANLGTSITGMQLGLIYTLNKFSKK